ncbi:MAG: DUF547 domain-containing protein [Deltaproteobacteria bacterium]
MNIYRDFLKCLSFCLLTAAFSFLIFSISYREAGAFDHTHKLYGKVLESYEKDGLVDYRGLKSDSGDLRAYIEQASSVTGEEFEGWSQAEQLAFLLNLYNARTFQLIIDNYPVESIKMIAADSKGPWEEPIVLLFGDKITLNALENDFIRKSYKEPRIHFALVCAAKGCPPLLGKPYTGSKLNGQLESQTRKFLADKDKNYVDSANEVIRLSPVFQWFEGDFSDKSGSVQAFVEPYFGQTELDDYKIEYTNYDWSLNDFSPQNN